MMTRKMMCKQGWKIVGMIVVIAGILGAWQPVQALEKVDFLFSWKWNGMHAPFFLAAENGYFADEGLEINFFEGQGSGAVAKIIAEGSSYQLGFIDYGSMMKGVAQGLPLKAIFGIEQQSPISLLSPASSPITSPKELEGKTVVFITGSSDFQMFPALLNKNQVDADKVTIIQTSFGTRESLLLQGRCDAAGGYLYGEPETYKEQGLDVHVLRFTDFGVNLLGHGIVANNAYLQTHEDLVARFVRAAARGVAAAVEEPAAAVDALIRNNPQLQDKREYFFLEFTTFSTLFENSNTQGHPLGWMSEQDWEEMQELLFEYGGLEQKLPLETYYTNDYIPTGE